VNPGASVVETGVYTNLEGYREVSESEIREALRSGPIILDTNVFLDLYELSENGRNDAFEILDSVSDQLWIPHQVMREFFRGRRDKILDQEVQREPLHKVSEDLAATINGYQLHHTKNENIEQIKKEIRAKLNEVTDILRKEQGETLDVNEMILDSSKDPVVQWIERRLPTSVGAPFDQNDYDQYVQKGLARFAKKIPPGFVDGDSKKDQLPERGTGDYLLWEQSLQYLANLDLKSDCVEGLNDRYFVLVTNDRKKDWRIYLDRRKDLLLPPLPALIDEGLCRTGRRLILLTTEEFYSYLSPSTPGSDQLLSELQQNTIDDQDPPEWTLEAYSALLSMLRNDGYDQQANVIEYAAQHGGFASRPDVYRVAPLAPNRLLNRFSLPANRMQLRLVEAGSLSERSASILVAEYDGPGQTIGYSIPPELVIPEAQGLLGEMPSTVS